MAAECQQFEPLRAETLDNRFGNELREANLSVFEHYSSGSDSMCLMSPRSFRVCSCKFESSAADDSVG